MNDTTHTTTTTTSDDVIALVVARLRDRLDTLDAQVHTLDSERIRIQRALAQLADEVPLPITPASALQQALRTTEAEASVRLDGETHITNSNGNGKQLPLQHMIRELLIADGQMKPTTIANALLSLGYQTKAKHFVQVVYMSLKKFRGDLFERNASGYWFPATPSTPRAPRRTYTQALAEGRKRKSSKRTSRKAAR